MANGASPLGQALTQPPVPAAGLPPAADPGLWQKLLQKMQSDPNFQTALLTTGLNLLGDPQQGESGFGTFSRSALSGIQTLDQLRARDRAEGRQTTQLDIQKEGAEASTSRAEAAGRQAGAAESRVSAQSDQFAQSLEENQRQFDARLAAGDFDRSTSSVSAVNARQQAAVDALITSNRYEDTPEGQANARLYVQGLDGAASPSAVLQISLGELDRRRQANIFLETPLSEQELSNQVFTDTQALLNSLTQQNVPQPIEGETEPASEFEGASVILPSGTEAQIVPVEGGFKLNNGTQLSDQVFTAEQIRTMVNGGERR